MLHGLSNTLQCSERDAMRIALYEAARSASKAYESGIVRIKGKESSGTILDEAVEAAKD